MNNNIVLKWEIVKLKNQNYDLQLCCDLTFQTLFDVIRTTESISSVTRANAAGMGFAVFSFAPVCLVPLSSTIGQCLGIKIS